MFPFHRGISRQRTLENKKTDWKRLRKFFEDIILTLVKSNPTFLTTIEANASNLLKEESEMSDKQQLPWWQKYTLTLNEASEYFGIGYKKLKQFVSEHKDEDFVLWNGNRAQIKREQFEKYLDSKINII